MTYYTENVDEWVKAGEHTEEEWQRRRRLIRDDIEDVERKERLARVAVAWGPPMTLAFSVTSALAFTTQEKLPRLPPDTGTYLAGPLWGGIVAFAGFIVAMICAIAFGWAVHQLTTTRKHSRWYGRRLRDHDLAYGARVVTTPVPEQSTVADATGRHNS